MCLVPSGSSYNPVEYPPSYKNTMAYFARRKPDDGPWSFHSFLQHKIWQMQP